MKKFCSCLVILAIIIVFSCSACGNENSKSSSAQTDNNLQKETKASETIVSSEKDTSNSIIGTYVASDGQMIVIKDVTESGIITDYKTYSDDNWWIAKDIEFLNSEDNDGSYDWCEESSWAWKIVYSEDSIDVIDLATIGIGEDKHFGGVYLKTSNDVTQLDDSVPETGLLADASSQAHVEYKSRRRSTQTYVSAYAGDHYTKDSNYDYLFNWEWPIKFQNEREELFGLLKKINNYVYISDEALLRDGFTFLERKSDGSLQRSTDGGILYYGEMKGSLPQGKGILILR